LVLTLHKFRKEGKVIVCSTEIFIVVQKDKEKRTNKQRLLNVIFYSQFQMTNKLNCQMWCYFKSVIWIGLFCDKIFIVCSIVILQFYEVFNDEIKHQELFFIGPSVYLWMRVAATGLKNI
jgi:hypothetical protein